MASKASKAYAAGLVCTLLAGGFVCCHVPHSITAVYTTRLLIVRGAVHQLVFLYAVLYHGCLLLVPKPARRRWDMGRDVQLHTLLLIVINGGVFVCTPIYYTWDLAHTQQQKNHNLSTTAVDSPAHAPACLAALPRHHYSPWLLLQVC